MSLQPSSAGVHACVYVCVLASSFYNSFISIFSLIFSLPFAPPLLLILSSQTHAHTDALALRKQGRTGCSITIREFTCDSRTQLSPSNSRGGKSIPCSSAQMPSQGLHEGDKRSGLRHCKAGSRVGVGKDCSQKQARVEAEKLATATVAAAAAVAAGNCRCSTISLVLTHRLACTAAASARVLH